MGSQSEEDVQQGSSWQLADQVVPHSRADKQEEQLGSERDCATQGSRVEN